MKTIILILCLFSVSVLAEPELHWLSTGLNNRDLTIHPDGSLLLTTLMSPKNLFAAIAFSTRTNDGWSDLQIAPFSGEHQDIEAMFAPAGDWLYFASKRPRADRDGDDWDIWRVSYRNGTWGSPENLGPPVNTAGDEFYPSLTRAGNLYFTATRDESNHEDIYVATRLDEQTISVTALGSGVNSTAWEFNAYIDPDENFLVFGSQGRQGEIGGGDLYISFRKDGSFQPATPLGSGINSRRLDYCPYVFDGRFYFSSERSIDFHKPVDVKTLGKIYNSPGNGMGDIYSVPLSEVLAVQSLTD